MLRVVVVDDSATARELIVDILSRDPELKVVGEAKNGAQAAQLAVELQPDVVTMDMRMPTMDGIEATRKIMAEVPTPIVIVSASTAIEDAVTSMNALQAGALTLLRKPPGPNSSEHEAAAKTMIETIKAMAEVKVVRRRHTTTLAKKDLQPDRTPKEPTARVVAIASSTGGPPVLMRILQQLPSDYPLPILITQHISRGFTKGFVHWLDSVSSLRVKIAEPGELLRKNTAYVAAEDKHLGVASKRTVDVSDLPPIAGYRPSATYLFRSVARAFGDSAIGVILTGMGEDGVDGLRSIHEAGGKVFAQDKESCVVYGMPGAAIEQGVVDRQMTVDGIAREISKYKTS